MEFLEYLISVRGAATAAAQVRGVAKAMGDLAVNQGRVATTGGAAAASTSRLGGAAALATKGIFAIGAAAVGIGLEAVKMSTSFNHEMLRIRTDAGASTKELANMKTGVLALASSGASMGQGPMSLAQGLYHLESLGIRGSRALKALALASQESAISGANLEETTTAMGAAMYVGIKGTGDLTHLMGTLNATVGAGNMRFQDLVEALGTGVLPSAKVAGLSIQDVSAALAVATDSGYKASSAAAQLGTAFHFLYAPTSKAEAALRSIGIGANQLGEDMHKPQGLLVALRDLYSHAQKLSAIDRAKVYNAILPGGRGRILLTELTMLDRLQGKYRQINATAGGFTGSVAMQTHDPQTQLRMGEARIQADMIRLGNMLTPVVIPALTGILNAGSQLLEWLMKLPHAIAPAIAWFKNLGSTVGNGSTQVGHAFAIVSHAATSLWGTLSKTFTQIIAAASHTFNGAFFQDLETIGRKLLWFGARVFDVVSQIVSGALPGLVDALRGGFNIIKGLVEFIAGVFTLDFSKMWKGLETMFSGEIGVVVGIVSGAAGALGGAASGLWDALKTGLVDVLNWIVGAINTVLGVINSAINSANSVTGSIPLVGGALHLSTIPTISPISTGPSAPSGSGASAPVGGHGHMQGLTTNMGHWNHGDIVLKVGAHEFARIQRHSIVNAMAAGTA